MTETEALARIAALCNEAEHNATRWHDPLPVPSWVGEVRAVLAEVQPTLPPGLEVDFDTDYAMRHAGRQPAEGS